MTLTHSTLWLHLKHSFLLLLIVSGMMPFAAAQHNLLDEFKGKPFLTNEHHHVSGTSKRSGTLTETLDFVFDSISAVSTIKGFNAAMLLPDGSVWKRASGLSVEVPFNLPLSTEHLMGMGSITKSFVSTTLLLLYEEGLLDLNDSIGKYVGPYTNVPGSVTIRQLLSHRSGINDYLNENPAMINAWVADLDSIWVMDTILNNYVLQPNFPVGASWSYSNTNYLLAGRIIENITGQPWYEVVRNKVIEPLGLSHTFAYPWESPGAQPFSHVWLDIDGDGTVDDAQGYGIPVSGIFSIAASAGCLLSTPEDLAIFSQKVYSGQVLLPETLAEMQMDYIQNGSGFLYGLGAASFAIPGNLENWGHDGNLFYKSIALYFPSENMSLAVQQNDNRSFDPSAPDPVIDEGFLFIGLLDAYLNYESISGTKDINHQRVSYTYSPNPATDKVTITVNQNETLAIGTIYLINAAGRVISVVQGEQRNEVVLNVTSFAPGVYFIEVMGTGNQLLGIRKLIIE